MALKKIRNEYKKTEDGKFWIRWNNSDEWAQIDADSVLPLKLHTWSLNKVKGKLYPMATNNIILGDGKYKTEKIILARYLMGVSTKQQVKFIDENHNNCLKSNFRIVVR